MEESKEMSFFSGPITIKIPCGETTLAVVYDLTRSKKFIPVTEMVRKDKAKKNRVLAYITPSGVFFYCKDSGIIIYSGYLNFDFDDLLKKYGLAPETVKRLLADDKFLNFNLINISVSGTGVKGILTVKGGKAQEHEIYYKTIERYLLDTFGLKADPACRNVSRAYYLSYDPDVYYNADGFVEREVLLEMDKAFQGSKVSELQDSGKVHAKDAEGNAEGAKKTTMECPYGTEQNASSTGEPVYSKPDYSSGELPSSKLNKLSEIHERAVAALKADGWQQNDNADLWTRPGKSLKEGCSAKYNQWDQADNIWFFTCFSTNAPHFGRRGYTDVQILTQLEYYGNFLKAISDLSAQYLD